MEGYVEKGPERIPTKDEVMDVIKQRAENAEIVKELSDDQGLYLLEAKIAGEKPGEVTQYEYIRKGSYPDGNKSTETTIHVVYYEDEIPVGGTNIADFNSETGEWQEVK